MPRPDKSDETSQVTPDQVQRAANMARGGGVMRRRRQSRRPSDLEALDMIDWYRRCLEDVQDGRPVRNLAEAKRGYDRGYEHLRVQFEEDLAAWKARIGV